MLPRSTRRTSRARRALAVVAVAAVFTVLAAPAFGAAGHRRDVPDPASLVRSVPGSLAPTTTTSPPIAPAVGHRVVPVTGTGSGPAVDPVRPSPMPGRGSPQPAPVTAPPAAGTPPSRGDEPAPPAAPGPAQPPRYLGTTDIRQYLRLAGDQVVTVPNGSYTAGAVAAPHARTDGPYRGWLVLVAQDPGQVVVDLSRTGFFLQEGDYRVLLVGFRFVNGLTRIEGVRNLRLWYCDFTFPPEEWERQYVAAGGQRGVADLSARSRMVNAQPSAIRMRNDRSGSKQSSAFVGIYGTDFQGLGDDGLFFHASSDLTFQGLRMWDIAERGYDPADWWHNDSIQTTGGVSRVRILDSYTSNVQWGAQLGRIADGEARRLWIANSTGVGWINDVWENQSLVRWVHEDIRVFANGQSTTEGYASKTDRYRVDILRGDLKVWPESQRSKDLDVRATGISESAPSGVAMSRGSMVDPRQAIDHEANPANRWRAANPYDSWPRFFGFTG